MKNLTIIFNLLLFPFLLLKSASVFQYLTKHTSQKQLKHMVFTMLFMFMAGPSLAHAVDYNLGSDNDDAEESIFNWIYIPW